MKKCCSFILVLVLVAICGRPAFAQRDSLKLITVELNNASIEQLVLVLEKQTSLHFIMTPHNLTVQLSLSM